MTGPDQSWFAARIGDLVRGNPDWAHLYQTDAVFRGSVDELPLFIARALDAFRRVAGGRPVDLSGLATPHLLQEWLEQMLDGLYRDAQTAARWRHETVEALHRVAMPDLSVEARRALGIDKDLS